MAKPLLKTKLRLAAVKALREAVLNNLGRTIEATAEFSRLVDGKVKEGLGSIIRFSVCGPGRGTGTGGDWPVGAHGAALAGGFYWVEGGYPAALGDVLAVEVRLVVEIGMVVGSELL